MKNTIIHFLGGYTREDIGKYNAHILNEFQNQGTPEMPFVDYDERVCLVPAIKKAMDLLDNN